MLFTRFVSILLTVLACSVVGPRAWAQTSAVAGSAVQNFSGLKLNCPVPLAGGDKPLPPGTDKAFVRVQSFRGKPEGVDTSVSSFECKTAETFDLAGAGRGALASVSKMEGISDAKHTLTPVTLTGADSALKLSFQATRAGKALRVEVLLIKKGVQAWQIMMVFDGGISKQVALAEAMMKSVRLQ